MQLSGGGDVVANDLGGRLLDGTPSDFREKRLLNVVEEMALASGVPVPMVYVMDHENSINAFAAGTEPTNAVIGVTRGCLERLDREELSGVIAHEFSHILNGDMRMNMKMVGWVFGLTAIAMVGQVMLRSLTYGRVGRRDRDSGQLIMAIVAFAFGLMIIGGLGVLCARFLQAAISRQREFLADASAVQFTRNPETIAGALEKIGGLAEGSEVVAPKASEASHMFFAGSGLFSFGLATHPPLDVRIMRIKKDWDGKFPDANLGAIKQSTDGRVSGFAGTSDVPVEKVSEQVDEIVAPPKVEGGFSIPPVFASAVHHPTEAQLLVFAMLVSSGGGTNGMEAKHLEQISDDSEGLNLIDRWSHDLGQMSSLEKTALIDLAIPTLRRMSIPMKERFIAITQELTMADEKISLFEYMLQQVIERHLVRHMQGASYSKIKYTSLSTIQAYSDSLHELMKRCQRNQFELSLKDIGYLQDALNICQHASPKVKNQLVRSLQRQAESDNVLTDHEAELLRAVADAIGCAIPLGELIHD